MQAVFLVKKSVLYRDNPLRLHCAHAANCYFKRRFEQAKTPNIHEYPTPTRGCVVLCSMRF